MMGPMDSGMHAFGGIWMILVGILLVVPFWRLSSRLGTPGRWHCSSWSRWSTWHSSISWRFRTGPPWIGIIRRAPVSNLRPINRRSYGGTPAWGRNNARR